MSQLVVRPGRNAARQAKRLKEIRKVQGAIVWHERERKKRQQKYQERYESKQAGVQLKQWENDNVRAVRKKALVNAREDWNLGPLRPNRAIGKDAEKYGAMTLEQLQKPEIPVHKQKKKNEYAERRGLQQDGPIIVDDEKYFHIVKDDRVIVMNGKDKGKIGYVTNIQTKTHEVVVKGVNMQYVDSDIFNISAGSQGPVIEKEIPIPMNDVRLVIPYRYRANGKEVFRDAIVERVVMERHTTGIDPFTGVDHGNAEFPKEHHYDPTTGLPIFNRYIAGTRHRIEWPAEKEAEIEDSAPKEEEKTIFKKTLGAIRHPLSSFQSWRKSTSTTTKPEETPISTKLEEIEMELAERRKTERPQSLNPHFSEAHNGDTTRNIVESAQSMAYSIVAPPFPNTLGKELRGHIKDFNTESRKNNSDSDAPRTSRIKRATPQDLHRSELAKMKHAAAQKMKTPMQLRWETEHAKKIKQQKTAPLVSTDELLAALGGHIQQQKLAKKASARVEEVE